jgi:hypothetical protein
MFQQKHQNAEWLRLKANSYPGTAQLAAAEIRFKESKLSPG